MIHIVYNKEDKDHPIWCENIDDLLEIPEDTFMLTRVESGEIAFDNEEPDLDINLEEIQVGRRRNHIWLNIHITDRDWRKEHGRVYLYFGFNITEEIRYYPTFTIRVAGEERQVRNLECSITDFGCEQPDLSFFECKFYLHRKSFKMIEIK